MQQTLSQISNTELHQKTLDAAQDERRATGWLIECLQENRHRRLYAEMGFSSLFLYVQNALGYSEAQTYERIRACELASKIPEIKLKLESGEISLTVLAKLASHVKREGTSVEKTKELAEVLTGCSVKKAEKILVQESTHLEWVQEKITPKTPEVSEVRFAADEALQSLLKRAQELCSEPMLAEVIRAGLKVLIAKKEKALGLDDLTKTLPGTLPRALNDKKKNESIQRSRAIPMSVRREVARKSGGMCEYVDPESGRRCGEQFGLQFEHVEPYAWGGPSTPENLKHFCRAHNRLAALKLFGNEAMQKWLEDSGRPG